ncbi:MAG: LLM class flavin-dependent oxidoreductase [Acidimicrobiales bacterium]
MTGAVGAGGRGHSAGEEAGPSDTSASEAIPFAPGSVSLRLYPHNDLAAPGVVAELCAQAGLATEAGFAGVMTSEHHGGFPGYLPNPLQMTGFILDQCPTGWAAACPLLLPLRPTALVAEEAAWLAARHPGRVGLGVAAGALPLDFEAMDVPAGTAVEVFRSELPRIVDMLRGQDLRQLQGDPALQACATRPVPVLSAAVSPAAARRAARCGAGILMEGMSPPSRLARLTAEYDGAGGAGAKVLIRRAWLGDVRSDLVQAQRRVYDSYTGAGPGFGRDQTVAADDPADLAEQLDRAVREAGADALNLRIHLPGMPPHEVRQQITRLGAEVVPRLRARPDHPWC